MYFVESKLMELINLPKLIELFSNSELFTELYMKLLHCYICNKLFGNWNLE